MNSRHTIAAALILISAAALCSCSATVPAPTLTHSSRPSPAADASSTEPVTTGPAVPVSRPVHLTFPAASIDGAIEEYTADQASADGGINPPTLEAIAWYSGVPDPMPGTNATNTVYIFGHTWVEQAVFNGLHTVRPGDRATVQTETGTLTYEVEEIVSMGKDEFSSDPTVAAVVPGRLVLVTCHRPEGWPDDQPAPQNTAVVMRLVGSDRA